MKNMKIKTKLVLGAIAICFFTVFVSTLFVTYIINEQNMEASYNLLGKAFNVVIDNLSYGKKKLLENTRRFANRDEMIFSTPFFAKHKTTIIDDLGMNYLKLPGQGYVYWDQAITKLALSAYEFGRTANVWRTSVYDKDGDLIAYANIENESASFGYAHGFPNPYLTAASLNVSQKVKPEEWKKINKLPNIDFSFGKEMPDREIIRFEKVDSYLCLVSYVPIVEDLEKKKTEAAERTELGLVKSIMKIDRAFVKRLAALTQSEINIFIGNDLRTGDIPEYKTLVCPELKTAGKELSLSSAAVKMNAIKINNSGYFQGVLPLFMNNRYIGAIVVLYSKDVAKANTIQMVKVLCQVGLGVILLMIPFAFLISNLLTKPLTIVVETANSIAKGDFSKEINIRQNDEIGKLADAFRDMQNSIGLVVKETDDLTRAVQDGNLDARGNTDVFKGGWRKLVSEVNNLIDSFVNPINMTAEYIEKMSKGDIPDKISNDYRGDFNKIKINLNMLINAMNETSMIAEAIAEGNLTVDAEIRSENDRLMKAMNSMIKGLKDIMKEMNDLTAAVREGRLDTRGNAEAYKGAWRELIIGVNSLIDAFADPINVTASYIERISKGDYPDKITEEYEGDFSEIKNSLNKLIENGFGSVRVAEKIAGGDLSVEVDILSDKDILGKSLEKMVGTIKMITLDINELTDATLGGRLDARGDADKFRGEYAGIIAGVNHTLDAVVDPLNTTAEYVDMISKGSIPEKIKEKYKGDFNAIRKNLNTMIENLGRFATDVQNSSEKVASGSEQLSQNASHVSEGMTEQAASIEQISASTEEFSGIVRQNADNARETASIAAQAARDAREGGKAVSETVSAMKSISEKILIVEEIARQTNMLALNAAIEAARAGEYGKGFAVVAAEVRKLAERSQKAAQEINILSGSNIEIAEKAGELLDNIVPGIKKTAELVEEISASATEQSNGIAQVNESIQQLDLIIRKNADLTEDMASGSQEFSSQAENLQQIASFFNVSDATGSDVGELTSAEITELKDKKSINLVNRKKSAVITTIKNMAGTAIELGDDDEFEPYDE